MSFWEEFKRRNVFKVGVAYTVVAWLLAQIGSVLFSTFEAPAIIGQIFVLCLLLGFPIALLFAWAYELTPAGIKPSSQVEESQSIRGQTGQRLSLAIVALLAVAVVFLVVDNYGPDTSSATSIAVLPFTNLTGDPAEDSFVDGFVVELHNSLSQIDDLRVTALSSSMAFRGSGEDVRDIAAQLGVDYLLEGRVNRNNESVRVVSSLIRGSDGSSVWSTPYDRQRDDPLSIQTELAETVADRLSATFGIGDFDLRRGGTDNVEAYDHYLTALGLFQRDVLLNGDTIQNELERALEIDPNFGLAQISLAQLQMTLVRFIGLPLAGPVPESPITPGPGQLVADTIATIERAREMVPDHPGILLFDAQLFIDARRWSEAEAAFRERLAKTGPSDYLGNLSLGNFLVDTGRAFEALIYLERAHELDPLASIPLGRISLAYDALGDYERAALANSEAAKLASYDQFSFIPHFWRVLGSGDVAAARQVLVDVGEAYSYENFLSLYEQHELAFANSVPPLITTNIGLMAAAQGDIEVALEATRRALLQAPAFLFNVWTPLMSEVRATPDFARLMTELGLPAFWRANGWPEHCRPSEPEGFECD